MPKLLSELDVFRILKPWDAAQGVFRTEEELRGYTERCSQMNSMLPDVGFTEPVRRPFLANLILVVLVKKERSLYIEIGLFRGMYCTLREGAGERGSYQIDGGRENAWFGHDTRSDSLSETVLQGTLEGGRRRGRQRKCWMDNVKEWTSLPVPELLTGASCRKD